MADPIAPAAACAGGIPCILVLKALGIDPIYMTAGLVGVVIVQTLLPRTESKFLAIAGVATGSMLLASLAAPFVAHALVAIAGFEWLKNIPPEHVTAAAAAIVGGFAQPLLLWIKSLLPKPKEAVQ